MRYSFGDYSLDPVHYELHHAGRLVPIEPRVFDVLAYLVQHAGQTVTTEELLAQLYPHQFAPVARLTNAVTHARKALGDTSHTPRYIQTVRRRGYRFIASVDVHTQTARDAQPHPAPTPQGQGEMPPPDPAAGGAAATHVASALPPPAFHTPDTLGGHSATPPALPDAERRQVTLLLCDLVEAPALARQLDPEDFREVIRTYHQTCAEVIRRFEGYLAPYLGAGVLASFGYPVAHEDDAQRAVRTGLGILEALDALNTQLRLPRGEHVAIRLGVHTGLAVVGTGGEGAHHEPLALGETPTIAAQLLHVAAPNTLVISAATYHLIAGYFTCAELEEQALRGLAHPLRLYRVLRPSGIESRLDLAATRGLTPLIGRTSEVALLRERWARVTAGMGQVVVLVGEAGMGKSRLVQTLKDHVASEVHTCLECRGVPYYQHTAWYPLIELFQRWLPWQPGTAPGTALAALEALLTQAQLPLEEAVPLFAALVALPLPAECYPPRPQTPEQQRQRTLDVLLALVEGLAAHQPVLLLVEDLHWVDPSTRELLGLLIDQVPTTSIYAVLTSRPEWQPPWDFRTHLTPLVLNRLTASQAATMVVEIRGGKGLSTAVVAQILAQTDGVPLFIEEVTKAVVEAGDTPDGLTLDGMSRPGSTLPIPVTLQEALLARLDRLGSAKGVAQLGATIGRQFPYALLRALSPLEDAMLQRDLASLVAAELLYQRGQPPRAVYTFKHALIQEAAYASVLKRVRRQTHQRLVAVLEDQFPAMVAATPELLARHALGGEQWEKAVTFFWQAGEQAVAHSAYQEAVAAFEHALVAVRHLPESRASLEQAIDLRLDLRNALYPLGEIEQLLGVLQDARALAETLGDHHRLGWVSVYVLAQCAAACDLDRGLTAGQHALAIATALGEVGIAIAAQYYLGLVYASLGEYGRAIACCQQNVMSLHGALRQEHFGLPGLAAVFSRGLLVYALAERGAFTEGNAPADEGVQMAEAADHPYSWVLAYWAVGFRGLRKGDLHQALPVLEQALALARGAHIRLLVPQLAAFLGAAYVLAGRTAEAFVLLKQAAEQAMAMGLLFDHALRVVWLGEAFLLAGQCDEAYTQAQRALAFARGHKERGHEAYALGLLGACHTHREPPQIDQATTYYYQALALAEELEMRPLQAHCHRSFGTLYAATGQQEHARTALAMAIAMYQSMEMTFWLPQTEAALAQLDA